MARLMRCLYCGLLQDEPLGVKVCVRCGGELTFEQRPISRSYVQVQMELDQINAPAGQIVDRHLVVTIQTPSQIPEKEAAPTEIGREAMSFTAVLDISGSMRGEKIASAKEAVRQAVQHLHDGDTFSLVTFADEVRTVFEPARMDHQFRSSVLDALKEVQAGGRTALCGGLEAGVAAARTQLQETNLVLLLSDGQANVGETDLEQVGSRALKAQRADVTVSTLGVGRDYNEALMVEIATQGGGRFYHVLRAEQIAPYVTGELGEMSALAARNARLSLTLPDGTGIQPFSAAYAIEENGVSLGDIPIDTRLEVILRLLLPPQPAGARLPIKGRFSYCSPAGNELSTDLNLVTVRFVEPASFDRRASAVGPVVERVLEQMKARSVLGSVRTAAVQGRQAADDQARMNRQELSHYASLLGEEAAERVTAEHRDLFAAMASAPDASKSAVHQAYSRQRSTKSFDKD